MSSIVAHCLLARIMYKSLMYTLEFTGAKKKKIKVEGNRPRNIYSLKYLVPSWQKIEEHEDPILSIKVFLATLL